MMIIDKKRKPIQMINIKAVAFQFAKCNGNVLLSETIHEKVYEREHFFVMMHFNQPNKIDSKYHNWI